MLAFLLADQAILDSLVSSLLAKLNSMVRYELALEVLKTLQNLSLVASQGFENKFKAVIETVTKKVLHREADSLSLSNLLILKEHAILIIGNLVFDSAELLRMTLAPEYHILRTVVSLIHFKRTSLTSAALWTINNFLN